MLFCMLTKLDRAAPLKHLKIVCELFMVAEPGPTLGFETRLCFGFLRVCSGTRIGKVVCLCGL